MVCLIVDDAISCIRDICRFALFDLRLRRCPWLPLVRMILPLPVLRNLLAVALCVFNLYFLFLLPRFFLGLIFPLTPFES
jgi:hypothetical protein